MLANGILADAGYNTFGYFEFAWIGMPMTIAGVIVVALLQKKILPETVRNYILSELQQKYKLSVKNMDYVLTQYDNIIKDILYV